jgi:hypothetical protein
MIGPIPPSLESQFADITIRIRRASVSHRVLSPPELGSHIILKPYDEITTCPRGHETRQVVKIRGLEHTPA